MPTPGDLRERALRMASIEESLSTTEFWEKEALRGRYDAIPPLNQLLQEGWLEKVGPKGRERYRLARGRRAEAFELLPAVSDAEKIRRRLALALDHETKEEQVERLRDYVSHQGLGKPSDPRWLDDASLGGAVVLTDKEFRITATSRQAQVILRRAISGLPSEINEWVPLIDLNDRRESILGRMALFSIDPASHEIDRSDHLLLSKGGILSTLMESGSAHLFAILECAGEPDQGVVQHVFELMIRPRSQTLGLSLQLLDVTRWFESTEMSRAQEIPLFALEEQIVLLRDNLEKLVSREKGAISQVTEACLELLDSFPCGNQGSRVAPEELMPLVVLRELVSLLPPQSVNRRHPRILLGQEFGSGQVRGLRLRTPVSLGFLQQLFLGLLQAGVHLENVSANATLSIGFAVNESSLDIAFSWRDCKLNQAIVKNLLAIQVLDPGGSIDGGGELRGVLRSVQRITAIGGRYKQSGADCLTLSLPCRKIGRRALFAADCDDSQ